MRQIISQEWDLKTKAVCLEVCGQKTDPKLVVLRSFIGDELMKIYLKIVSIGMDDASKL